MNAKAVMAVFITAIAVAAAFLIIDPVQNGSSDDDSSSDTGEDTTLAGTYATYSFTYTENSGGPFSRGSSTTTGTVTVAYAYYDSDRDAYYIEQFVTVDGENSSESYWTDETEDHTWSCIGTTTMEDLDGNTITVYVYNTTYISGNYTISETQYIDSDGLAHYMSYSATSMRAMMGGSSYSCIYALTGTGDYESQSEYSVTVYSESGITVTGTGESFGTGDSVTLTASGDSFYGWYDSDGNLLSTSATYTFTMAVSDVVIYAENSADPDATVTVSTSVDLSVYSGCSSGTYSVVDSDGGETQVDGSSYTFTDFGTYTVLCVDGDTHWMMTVYVNGSVDRTYTWTYNGTEYTYTLSIDYDDYAYYVDYFTVSERSDTYYTTRSAAGDLAFVYTDSVDDGYLQSIASYIGSITSGWSEQEKANMLLAFVEYIEYAYDSNTYGTSEYWATPLETLWMQCGDCEDTSILFCAIAREMGLDTCLFLMNGHMAAGIALDDFSAPSVSGRSYNSSIYGFTLDGTFYYYGETTGEGWLIGQVPSSVGSDRSYSNYFIVAMAVSDE